MVANRVAAFLPSPPLLPFQSSHDAFPSRLLLLQPRGNDSQPNPHSFTVGRHHRLCDQHHRPSHGRERRDARALSSPLRSHLRCGCDHDADGPSPRAEHHRDVGMGALSRWPRPRLAELVRSRGHDTRDPRLRRVPPHRPLHLLCHLRVRTRVVAVPTLPVGSVGAVPLPACHSDRVMRKGWEGFTARLLTCLNFAIAAK